MMRVWSQRPQFLHLGLFFAAYVLGCGFAESLAIVPGTGISIWPPAGLFIATLILAPRPSWPWWVIAGCLAELFANALWFHSPLPAAFLIYVGNALEAVVGAWLVNRTCKQPLRLESLQEVLAFVVFGAGIAPAISATVGSATLAWFGMQGQTFTGAWPLWWIGDATGVLIVGPLALVVFQNWRGTGNLSAARWVEAGILGLIFLGVAALSLSGYLPFAYIIMPPLLWAAVRFEFKGAVVTLALLALITALFTISGSSQFAGDPESQRHRQVMLQLFLAISAGSALIVAAISRQYQLTLLTLRQSERQLQQMIDTLPVRIWSMTPAGGPLYFNKRYQDHFRSVVPNVEASEEPRIETFVQGLTHPEDAPVVLRTLRNCFETGAASVMRFRWREKDGAYRWAECRVEPRRDQDEEIVQWYGVSIDIDDEMRAQAALRDREQELSQLVDMVPSHVWRLTPSGEPTFFNKRMVEYLGFDVADTDRPGMSRLEALATALHPDDATEFTDTLQQSLDTGERFSMRYRLRRADGVYRWMSSRAEPMRDQGGCIVQWYGLCHDIDDQMHAEETLRESEQQLRRLIDALPTQIWAATAEGEPSYLNRRLAEYVGLTLSDLDAADASRLQVAITSSVHPDDAPSVGRALVHSFTTGETFAMKYRQRRADGVYRWINGRAEPLRDPGGRIVQWYGVSFDIDDEVRTQEELRRTQERLAISSQAASLSELSASIAHEVNQPLAAIVANSNACQRWLSAEPPNIERAKITAERIIRDANAAADVVSRIRALFRQSVQARAGTTLAGVIAEARNLMADEAARRRVRIDVDVPNDLPPVALDRVQIQQVLINLMRNGIEAMDGIADAGPLGVRVRRRGDVVQTEVSDRGAGIENPDRMFEPFFTTKEHGMGMGLAICRSIVESHGGRLWAEKNEPHGTIFIFTLPVEANAAP